MLCQIERGFFRVENFQVGRSFDRFSIREALVRQPDVALRVLELRGGPGVNANSWLRFGWIGGRYRRGGGRGGGGRRHAAVGERGADGGGRGGSRRWRLRLGRRSWLAGGLAACQQQSRQGRIGSPPDHGIGCSVLRINLGWVAAVAPPVS